MSVASVFVGSQVGLNRSDALSILRESVPGLAVVLSLGYLARFVSLQVSWLDPLVAGVLLGMIVRFVLGAPDVLYFKLLPGFIVAQSVFIPIGIILYGQNLDFRAFAGTSPLLLAQVMFLVATTFTAMYVLGRRFGLRRRFLFLLGFGSAVCGASAIAITSPVTECEPDDAGVGLVNNTIAVALAVGLITLLMKPILPSMTFAALAGSTLHQTGFVKMALATEPKSVAAFGLAVKSIRIALLIISIPVVSYILRRRVYIPWYLVLFLAAGYLFSYGHLPIEVTKTAADVYTVLFAAALASVGLNADIHRVSLGLIKPLALILIVYLIDVGLFMATRGFVTY